MKFLTNLPRLVVASLIRLYQLMLSPDHGWLKARHPYGYCRFYPTCSEYGRQAILKFGVIKGGWLSAKRVARCHPGAQPSVDLVP